MKAIVHESYGSPDLLQFREVEKPVVQNREVLVRVLAAAANPLDWHLVRGKPYLVRIPSELRRRTIPGVDLAGRVEAVGNSVTQFRPGDEVFGASAGAFAEYASVPEDRIVTKPANLTFEQAAAVPVAAFTALQGLRDKGRIQAGQRVLINGASGGVGTFAVQIARSFAADVTGVCSTGNVDLVRSIGADHVIDYTREDFTRSGPYDLMLDTVGNRYLSECRRALKPEGVYVSVGAPAGDWIGPLVHVGKVFLASMVGSQTMQPMLTRQTKEDLLFLQEFLESATIVPVIGRRYTLSEVPEAILHQETGHARGKTVITVGGEA